MTVPSVQDRIDAYWTRRAPAYDDHQQRPDRRELDRAAWADVWTAALPLAPADVLDVGTGSGHVACLLAALGHRVTGIDLAEGMLERAREHAASLGVAQPPRFLRGDAVDPDLPAGSVDAVTGRYVMWTLREPVAAVRRWAALLRPGGVVAVVDSTWFPEGVATGGEAFTAAYDDDVVAALPLAEARSIDATADVLRAAGLLDVTVTPLTAVLDLDRAHGVAPGHEVRPQHLVTGRVAG
ncbi:class I SAM-dependent methyltransferase [Nocardioides sp. Arc9.136]|uniref:class I SAM-dependent methyltransferase n=1 Tax=Nocardioides sp. Arc9.136 TaxID=2996826 RepID=UPI0026664A4C|nr:class I SAM-dependent methyltransferase [Nocardioides sp. Arc9.136]WKN47513.1 class I SAM-dependent methyltransferase [Nocardioides sp. Arc9.136]